MENTNIKEELKLYAYSVSAINQALTIIDKEMKPVGIESIRAISYLIDILTHPYSELTDTDLKEKIIKDVPIFEADKAEVSE